VADRAGSAAQQYERLSSRELHDLAVRRARRHLDLSFFWYLMELRPAGSHLHDVAEAAGRAEVAEQLRPFYIDYLTRQG
jgi:hypothetical protein